MTEIHKKRHHPVLFGFVIFMILVDLGLVIRYALHGNNVALLNPKGFVAQEQHNLALFVVAVLCAIAIPTLFLLYFTAWKYRESNPKAVRALNARHGKFFDVSIWFIPTAFMLVLAIVMWSSTHRLVPQHTLAADAKPLRVQVISLRWKWLFLYPDQKIATVNFVQIPVDTPVQFELTADEAPMSSFWIPNLGGQLYSMTSHVNRLNLMADTPGDYPGSSAEINGAGFSGMKFTARASTSEAFDRWVEEVRQSPDILDSETYASVLRPSEKTPAAFYSSYERGLYDSVLAKYAGSHDHTPAHYEAEH